MAVHTLIDGIVMGAVKTWNVRVDIDEHEGRTRAVARLRTDGDQSLAGTGLARLNPADGTSRRSATSSRSPGRCRS